ncbi:MAG: PilZ domain-containing protein [Hyphomicrobiaceae bacterium]
MLDTPSQQTHWEVRQTRRRRVLKGGVVAFNDRHCTLSCTVRDISMTGAHLRTTDCMSVPDKFELVVEIDGLEANCEVVWRKGADIGVKFVGSLKTVVPKRQQVIDPVVPEDTPSLRRKPKASISNIASNTQFTAARHQEQPPFSNTRTGLEEGSYSRVDNRAAGDHSDIAFQNDFLALVVTLYPEVLRTCITLAISGCVANAMSDNVPDVNARSLIKYFPRESSKLVLASIRIGQYYENSELYSFLDSFNSKLTLAKDATIRLAEKGAYWGIGDQAELYELAESWRTVSNASRIVLFELDNILTNHGMHGSSREIAPLSELLESVVRGEYPLIDQTGNALMPKWAERRKFERTPVKFSATLHVNGSDRKVIVRDISATGLGLDSSGDLAIGEEVVVQIEGAPRLIGRVVWSTNSRSGIKLLHPLNGPDPRLMFCSKPEANNDH